MTDINITHNDIYKQLKAILDGCDTILDALPFCNMYANSYPDMKSMIFSYTNGKTYKDTVDIKTKQSMLNDINLCTNRNDALELFARLTNKTTDDVYKKTLERIARRKNYRKLEQKIIHIVPHISKKCPHCSYVLNLPENTNYVICGYQNTNQGYDWNGCGKDWCFYCGKMLCKKWEINALNLQINRNHDDACCSAHATNNGNKYPDDYCQCNNINIHRENNNILKNIY
jgi:hypothetical protein